jgi:adenylosuccinate synthase
MASLTVVGAQWGDEGKGKIVDYITESAHWVVRFQGGNNAGHTLVIGDEVTKLHVIPSGIIREQCRCCIGAGVVVDAVVVADELDRLTGSGVKINGERLLIDERVELILPFHKLIDLERERLKGSDRIGTTGRGIGPCYEDQAERVGFRLNDLLAWDSLYERLLARIAQKNLYLECVLGSKERVSYEECISVLEVARDRLLPYMTDVGEELDSAYRRGEHIVFEGAQGILLDKVFGAAPFVTSSNTLPGAVTIGCGVGPKCIGKILGVAKAYATRVGSGPFPTAITGEIDDEIRRRGNEFGTTTGRPRRCGWIDAVALRYAIRIGGIEELFLTKLDVLSGLGSLKIAEGYFLDGVPVNTIPASTEKYAQVLPKYIELPGWKEDLQSITEYSALPQAARTFVETLECMIQIPIVALSVGPERSQSIIKVEGFLPW